MRREPAPVPAVLPTTVPRRRLDKRLRAYVALSKPRIIELLLVTTVPVMFLAAGGVPRLGLVAATVAGGTLAAASANILNCFVDRDIDKVMRRTRGRPLAAHTVEPLEALALGVVLGVVATLWLGLTVNPLSAALALGANLFYVLVYSLILKRRTSANIVWGGAAGCVPTLIGWSAVTGGLGWPPVVLFAVVFFWTPPHVWALALRFRDDYAAANVPMLPVVVGPRKVARHIAAYTVLTVGCSLLLWPVAGTGPLYPAVAGLLGVRFLAQAARLLHRAHASARLADLGPMRLFHESNLYLALLFLAVAVDTVAFA